MEDLVQFGAAHTRVVREIEDVVADRALAKALGCAAGTRWLRISSLRLNGEPGAAPIGWTDVYMHSKGQLWVKAHRQQSLLKDPL